MAAIERIIEFHPVLRYLTPAKITALKGEPGKARSRPRKDGTTSYPRRPSAKNKRTKSEHFLGFWVYFIQFTDLSATYFFGVATFDNASVRHAFQTGAAPFVFKP